MRQTKTDRQPDRQTFIFTGAYPAHIRNVRTERKPERERERERDRQPARDQVTARPRDRQTPRQRDRETDSDGQRQKDFDLCWRIPGAYLGRHNEVQAKEAE